MNTLLSFGLNAFPNNPRAKGVTISDTGRGPPGVGSSLATEIPGLSTETHFYSLYHPSPYRRRCNSWEELKALVESQTENNTYTMDLGWNLYPHMDYDSGDQLKDLIDEMKIWDKFQLLEWRFANGWDMYDVGETQRIVWFKKQIGNINPEQVHLQFANVRTVELYKKHFPTMNICVYLIYYTRMINKNLGYEFIANKGNRDRYFICFNNYSKEHRATIVKWIKENKWQDRVHYSFLSEGKTLGSEVTKGNTKPQHITHWQDSPPHDYINRSYFYVVTETHYDAPHVGASCGQPRQLEALYDLPSFVSEKTLKAFQYEMPFIIVGLPHTLTSLRLMGYETFPELFDESYDTELDSDKRMVLIKDAVQKLMNKSLEELHEIVMQPSVQATLLHNKRLFLKNYAECPSRKWDPIDPTNLDNKNAAAIFNAKW